MKLALAAIATTAALGLTTTSAHAENKSWAALKGSITSANTIAVSVDLVPIKKLPSFDKTVASFIAMDNDVKQGFDILKNTCSIDITKVITDVTVLMNDDKEGAVAIGFETVDRAALEACLGKLAAQDKKTVTNKAIGSQTEYSVSGESDKLHLTWYGTNVVALATDPMNAQAFGKAVGKADPKSALAGLIGKTKTDAPVWFAVAFKDELPTGGSVSGAYGRMDITKDKISGVARVIASSAAEAATFVTKMKPELQKEAKKMKKLPELQKVLLGMKVTSVDAEIEGSSSVPVKSLDKLIQQVMKEM